MILRYCVCIPTFDNPETIVSVVEDALKSTQYAILVVDDGSKIPVEVLLRASNVAGELGVGRVHVARVEKNSGKGVALKTAIEMCVTRGFTHMIAIDGDGQHHAREVAKLVEVSLRYPWDLVIGRRKLDAANVPTVSRFGRAFSNFWVNYQTGVPVTDSQSGFRLYPLFHVQNMKFATKRYDFEIEILIRLMWKNVKVREVDIDVFYPEPHLRVSHFNKFYDNARISLLNTVLVFVSLLKSQISNAKLAISFGFGIFLGCTPFFGFHFLLVAISAFIFRLNAGVMLVGSQISIPPFLPFLIFGSVLVGREVLGEHDSVVHSVDIFRTMSASEVLHFAQEKFQAWLIGSAIVGLVLGVAGGLALYMGLARSRRKAPLSNWNGRSRGGAFGNAFLRIVLQHLGVRAGYFILYFIVPYFYLFAPKARRALNEYWSIISPGTSTFSRQLKVMAHIYRFGQVLMDQVIQKTRQEQKKSPIFSAKPHGLENIKGVMDRQQGTILLNAHIGSWSLAIDLLKTHSLAFKLKVVQYRADPTGDQHGDDVEQSVFAIRDLLSKGTPIGLMGDRPLQGRHGRFELVRFMGKLAPFDSTPFKLAAATGAPVIVTFGFKGHGNEYEFFADPPKYYRYEAGEDRQLACERWVQDYADQIAEKIRKYPDQWFNFFPFWSSEPTRPDERVSLRGESAVRQINQPLANISATTNPAGIWLGI